jgi:hypothetical protein
MDSRLSEFMNNSRRVHVGFIVVMVAYGCRYGMPQ